MSKPKVLTLYIAAHGIEYPDMPLIYKPTKQLDDLSSIALLHKQREFTDYINTNTRMVYAQGCTGIVNKISYVEGLIDETLEKCYKLFFNNKIATYTILSEFVTIAKEDKCKEQQQPFSSRKTLRSSNKLHNILLSIIKENDSIQVLYDIILHESNLDNIKTIIGEKDNKHTDPLEFMESLGLDKFYKVFNWIESIPLKEILQSVSNKLNTIEEAQSIIDNINKSISKTTPEIANLSMVTIGSVLPIYNVVEKYEPDTTFEDDLYESSCYQSFHFAKPIHEKEFHIHANEEETVEDVVQSQYGIHMIDCRGFSKIGSQEEYKMPNPITQLRFRYPTVNRSGNSIIVESTGNTPSITTTVSTIESPDDDTTVDVTLRHNTEIVDNCSIANKLNEFCKDECKRNKVQVITLSSLLSFCFDNQIDMINVIDMTCRSSDILDLVDPTLELVKDMRDLSLRERYGYSTDLGKKVKYKKTLLHKRIKRTKQSRKRKYTKQK